MAFNHFDDEGRAHMVDVSGKQATDRSAHARTVVHLPVSIAGHLTGDEIETKKGPVFATAIIAGVMAAKKKTAAGWTPGTLTGERLGDYSYTVGGAGGAGVAAVGQDLLPEAVKAMLDEIDPLAKKRGDVKKISNQEG